MSILEIILYSVIGIGVTLYITRGIIQIVDRKKHPDKYNKKEENEELKQDE